MKNLPENSNFKIKTLDIIISNFEEFDRLKTKILSSLGNEYLKNFMKLIKKNNKENYELLETPIHVLAQRCNYLKGKTALFCKDYETALKFFFIVLTIH